MVITALTRNQVGGNVSWVRIPPTPLSRKLSKYAGLRLFYLFKRALHFMSFCVILCYFLFCRRFARGPVFMRVCVMQFFSVLQFVLQFFHKKITLSKTDSVEFAL